MGQDAIPIATLDTKVNDGKYHRVKFVRNGADAMLQVDWEKEYKNPVGKLIFSVLLLFANMSLLFFSTHS